MHDPNSGEARRSADYGPERLRYYLVNGILNDDFVAAFFSQVRKVPAKLRGALAAVTMTDSGVKLVYDAEWIANATDEQIQFTLCHELMHVLDLHFIRAFDLMDDLSIGVREFFGAYAPLADALVNNSLKTMKGAKKDWKNMLTYDKLPSGVTYDTCPTFESIVRYMYQNHPPAKPGTIVLKGGEVPTVVKVDDQGNIEIIQSGDTGAPVVVVPDVTREGQREHMEDVKNLVESAVKSAGNAPAEIQKSIDDFLESCQDQVLKGWNLLQRLLNGYRTINKGLVRSLKRLNRRTMMLPGKVHVKGFRALFITDESGSMSDEDVAIAVSLAKRTIIRTDSDKMYYVHWDTEPVEQVEELKTEEDVMALERKKCGGTNFTELFSHKVVRECDVDLYVIVTDGYPYGGPEGGWPVAPPPVPAVWIITTKPGLTAWEQQCHKGIAVCVEGSEAP